MLREEVEPGLARLCLIGGFSLCDSAGVPVAISNRRGRGLLAYLSLAPEHSARRERLSGLMWSDRGEAQARASLRQCLFELRDSLAVAGLDILEVGRESVALRADRVSSDVAELQLALVGGSPDAIVAALGRTQSGPLLEDSELGGMFQDWLDQTRPQLEQAFAKAVQAALGTLEAAGRWSDVQAVAEAFLRRDPLDEAVVAAAIRADAATGNASAAHRRLQNLKAALAKEFGVAPGAVVRDAMALVGRTTAQLPPAGASLADPRAESASIGASVTTSAGAPAAAKAGASPDPRGERRHLTFLSCTLTIAMRIAAGLDPETWRDIVTEHRRAAGLEAGRMGGHVVGSLRDGLLAYFGYPEAQEDAAERAVRAGLAIVNSMAALNQRFAAEAGGGLQARIAIHTGTVVVAQDGEDRVDLFGDAPTMASRAEGLAAPGAVVMTGATHDLVSGLFVIEDLGARPFEGVGEPVRLYRAIRPGLAGVGMRGFSRREATPFVGREDELQLLSNRWRRVRGGEGQVVLVTGEPGIGKTRLINEFRGRIRADPHLWIGGAGLARFANTPFHAVIEMLNQGLGGDDDEGGEGRVARLQQALAAARGVKPDEAVPLILEMLDLPVPKGYPPLRFAPDERRRRLLVALVGWVFSAALSQPLVIAVDDLQWIDPSTMELIHTLALQGAQSPLMLICTARPEFRPTWPVRGHHVSVSVDRLSDPETRELVAGVITRGQLPKNVVESVIESADGVPLFAEELARLMVESGGRGGAREIPATLRDSLAARLDRLGRAKDVAQLASVLGREFSYDLLQAVSSMPEEALQADLKRLAESGLIDVRGLAPDALYRFKHVLIQDAAYEALLKSRRRELHAKVARTIVERFAALAQAHPDLLARHWAEAGEAEPAIAAWMEAGDGAYGRRAFKEAETSYRRALTVLTELQPSLKRDQKELALYSALNRVLQLTRGYAAPETVEAAGRAKALAEKGGSISQLIREEARIWRGIITSGDYAGAAALADHILELARGEGANPGRLLFAHNAQVQTRFYTGDLAGVEEHFALLSPLIDAEGIKQAPGNNVISLGVASLAAWAMGRTSDAHERMNRALAFAELTQNPYDMAMTLHFRGVLHSLEREPERAQAAASQLLALAEDSGFSYAGDLARGTLGWALALRGELSEGIACLRQAWESLAASGATGVGQIHGLNQLAETLLLDGQTTEAFIVIEEALSVNPQERIFRPESLRRRGEWRLGSGEDTLAEADFRAAIAMAQEMGAKAWELRAAISLARRLQQSGETAAARDLLAPLCDALAGEQDSADLREAASLLGQLDSAVANLEPQNGQRQNQGH